MKHIKCPSCEDVLKGGQYHRMKTCSCGAVSYDWHDLWPRVILDPEVQYTDVEWIEDEEL